MKDANALLKAMKTMIEDKENTQMMAQKRRKTIQLRYEQTFVRQCLANYYEKIIPYKIAKKQKGK